MEDFQFQALSPEQRIAKQRELQNKGLYSGALDGKLGEKTRGALAMERMMAARQPKGDPVRMRELELQAQREQRAAEAKARRAQGASPVWDIAVPAGTGALVGATYGEIANRALNRFDTANARALAEIGDELGPTKDMTASQVNRARAAGAARAAERFSPTSTLGKTSRLVGRASTYGIPAAAILNEYRRYQTMANDPNLSEEERMASQRLANGFLGVGSGIGMEGGRRFYYDSRPAGIGRAEMRIQAANELAKRMDDADAMRSARVASTAEEAVPAARAAVAPEVALPAPASPPLARIAAPAAAAEPVAAEAAVAQIEAPARTHAQRLIAAAKKGGATGNLTKRAAATWLNRALPTMDAKTRAQVAAELGVNRGPNFSGRIKDTLGKLSKTTGKFGIIAPLAGAAIGWEMAGDGAQASTGDNTGGSDWRRKAEGAAIGGGVTAGTMYGLKKMAETPVGRAATRFGGRLMYGASLPFDAYAQATETDPERQPFTRRAEAFAQGQGNTPAAMARLLQSELGATAQDIAPEYMEQGRQFLARNIPASMQSANVRAAGAREQMGMTPAQTDDAFEAAMAEFERMHAPQSGPTQNALAKMMR